MKKALFVMIMILFVAVIGFTAPTGSVSSETSLNADADAMLGETIKASLTIGALSLNGGLVLTTIGVETGIDITGDIAYAFGDAVAVKLASSYGIDSEEKIPVTLTVDVTAIPNLALQAKYVNDDLNPEDGVDVEFGTVTIKATYTF